MSARAVACAVVAVAHASAAQGYVQLTVTGHPELPLTWSSRCMRYRIAAEGSVRTPGRTEEAAIDAAFASWAALSQSCSNWSFIKGLPVPPEEYRLGVEVNEPAATQVLFREVNCGDVVPLNDPCRADPETARQLCANAYQCMYAEDSVIGLTFISYNPRTGQITNTDIEFNASPPLSHTRPGKLFTTVDRPVCPSEAASAPTCVAYDIQNTLTHELGHAFGFGHVVNSTSTMYGSANFGETSKRVIDSETADGFCTVYPASRGQTCGTGGSGLVLLDVAIGSCSAMPNLAAPLAGVWLLTRLRRRRSD